MANAQARGEGLSERGGFLCHRVHGRLEAAHAGGRLRLEGRGRFGVVELDLAAKRERELVFLQDRIAK